MTTKVLRLDSSIFGPQGASTRLNDAVLERLRERHGPLEVTRRDLAAEPLPHVDAATLAALAAAPDDRTPWQRRAARLADLLVEEVREADILVIAAPMYNFSVPSTLKTWMDFVARAGVSFKYTENGPVGLLGAKRVYISSSRGGVHRGAPTDGVAPLLQGYFGLLGMEVEIFYAEGLNLGEAARAKGMEAARGQIARIAA